MSLKGKHEPTPAVKSTFKSTAFLPKGGAVTSISHPALRPSGFHPLLNGAAARDRALVTHLLDLWETEGFAQVAPIQVDSAEILLKGRPAQVQNRAFRFMDPENGAMLALLPDVTFGIARLAAGELAEVPRPLHLSYEGQAIRVSSSAARPLRQFGQVGVEVIGADAQAPVNITALALKSLKNLGLKDLHLSLVLPPLAENLIEKSNLPKALAEALDRKDEGKIRKLAGDQAEHFFRILEGDFTGEPSLKPLEDLAKALTSQFPEIQIRCEPFEQRGFAFQTGPSFALYAASFRGEIGRGGSYVSNGESCFGFTLYRDALLDALKP